MPSAEIPQLHFQYTTVPIEISYDGRQLQARVLKPDIATLKYESRRYHLHRLIFHTPAEHRIGEDIFDLEVQLEHQDASGKGRLFLALFFNEGHKHPELEGLVNRLPKRAGYSKRIANFDIGRLLSSDQHKYYRYVGSQTYPPCEEGVLWVLMARPSSASRLQIDRIAALIEGRGRPVQPLLSRMILEKL